MVVGILKEMLVDAANLTEGVTAIMIPCLDNNIVILELIHDVVMLWFVHNVVILS